MKPTTTKEGDVILVIDDEEVVTGLLRALLTNEGYVVHTAGGGREAVDLALKVKPKLIIMDILMPDLDGYQATELIKQNPTLKEIPVIFLTGRSPEEDAGRAYATGATTFLRKPFSDEQIKNLVALALQSVRA
ncbi:MAG: response regulator [candidate division Zixibacteria bacterium]|nr:response regulator [candidate division Zixibacteria bacterium]